MKTRLATFLVGSTVGVIIGFGSALLAGGRYQVTSEGLGGIKLDRWTGKSWMMRYYENNGSKDFFWELVEQQ